MILQNYKKLKIHAIFNFKKSIFFTFQFFFKSPLHKHTKPINKFTIVNNVKNAAEFVPKYKQYRKSIDFS